MARGLKPPRPRSPRVEKHWGLLVQMQKLIEDTKLSPNKAAVVVAKDNWRSVSKTELACVQWLKDNQRKFRGELRPSTLLQRLVEYNDRRNPNWREELQEQMRRGIEWAEKTVERMEKERRAAEEAAREVNEWHARFSYDPKGAIAELLNEIQRDKKSFDD
jgi:hypothetical protein